MVRGRCAGRAHRAHALTLVLLLTPTTLAGVKTFGLFQVAAKCYQKGGAFEKEKLALAHNAALNMKSKKVSPK